MKLPYSIRSLELQVARLSWLRNRDVKIDKSSRVRATRLRVALGSNILVEKGALVDGYIATERAGARVEIMNNVFIGNSVISSASRIHFGARVLVSWGCAIVDHDSHPIDWKQRQNDCEMWAKGQKDWSFVETAPVTIEEDAWIGMHSIVLKGVTVGARSIVAAGSVVTRNVPPDVVVAGSPAKVIRKLVNG